MGLVRIWDTVASGAAVDLFVRVSLCPSSQARERRTSDAAHRLAHWSCGVAVTEAEDWAEARAAKATVRKEKAFMVALGLKLKSRGVESEGGLVGGNERLKK